MMGLTDKTYKKVYTGNVKDGDIDYDIVSPKEGEVYYVSTDSIDPYYGEAPYIEAIEDTTDYDSTDYDRSQLVIKETIQRLKEYKLVLYIDGVA